MRKYINVGIDIGEGTAYYRVPQFEKNDYFYLEEIRDINEIKGEVLELFLEQLLKNHKIKAKSINVRNSGKNAEVSFLVDLKDGVSFDVEEYEGDKNA